MLRHFASITLFFLLTASLSSGQDTPSSRTPPQAKASFAKADADLNQTWAGLKKTLTPGAFAKLLELQRQWLAYRDDLALSPAYSGAPSGEKEARQSAEYFDTAAQLTEERTAWLKAYGEPLPNGSLTGLWNDSHGGYLQIIEKPGALLFSIQVVRGRTAHTGELSGTAKWKSPKGSYSDKGLVPDKAEETTLEFTLTGNILEITGTNTGYYHGMRAYFDGTYLRIGDLSEEDKKTLTQDVR